MLDWAAAEVGGGRPGLLSLPGVAASVTQMMRPVVADEVQACPLAVLRVPGAWVKLVNIVSGI